MFKSIKNNRTNRGFTIVELLVVIVVIGILASITIVSYTGITQRANSAASQSAASNAINKASIYYADQGSWPNSLSLLTGATADKTYSLTGVTYSATMAAQPGSNSTIMYEICGIGSTTTAPVSPVSNIVTATGVRVTYWKYDGTAAAQTYTAGQTSGLYNTTYNIGCIANNA